MEPLDLKLTTDPTEAKRLRNELHRWLLQAGINGATGHDITLSAVEAFTNSATHPLKRASNEIQVHGQIDDDAITLTVDDDGHWRQPNRTQDSGGFGLALMKSFMTNVHIHRTAHGTRVILQRTLGA